MWRRSRRVSATDADAERALADAEGARARIDMAARRIEPALARLERHRADDHVYDAVMATILGGRT